MTPPAEQMDFHLSQRRLWFHNEWFFKWHQIGRGGGVEIDTFDGRKAHFGGIEYSGSATLVFWDAVTRGVRKEINEQFAWLDEQARRYNRETADSAITECAGLLASFAEGVRRDAIEKDRVLRGRNGKPAPSGHDQGRWHGLSRSELLARGEALRQALQANVRDVALADRPAAGAVLTEDQRKRVLVAIRDAELRIEGLDLDNVKRSQVLAYVVAAKQLAEAPEPPADLIWQLISRASDVLGLVGFFGMLLQVIF